MRACRLSRKLPERNPFAINSLTALSQPRSERESEGCFLEIFLLHGR